jgi:signal transduction histidine kinase
MMEILVSKQIASEILQRTKFNFMLILVFLILSGGVSIYAIFLLQRKHQKKMETMEKEIEMKERLISLGKLASGMAHEIKNPLNAISMSVQRLKREFEPEKEKQKSYHDFIDIIRAELSRVDRIVEEFLLSTKKQAPFLQENIQSIVEEVITLIKEKADSKGIKIKNTIDKGISIECQKERLKQVFYNIILNGIEAIQNRGVVEISSEVIDGNLNICVKDSGVGINKEHLQTIFEYYYTTKDKGIGLGLPISYMIIKDHGGDIRVTSEEGKGAMFIVSFPAQRS